MRESPADSLPRLNPHPIRATSATANRPTQYPLHGTIPASPSPRMGQTVEAMALTSLAHPKYPQ